MKTLRYFVFIMIGALLFSCEVEYESSPNSPEIAPTYGIMNRVQKRFMDETRDEWFSGRMVLLWVQYWNQVNYTEEDRFQYRETVNQEGWDDIYANAQDLISIIELNTDEATAADMEKYGPNEGQIAAAQTLLSFVYLHAVELWGDVPYWSFGSANESFQANKLRSDDIDKPAYAKQADIYADMLNVLDAAQQAFAGVDYVMDGDNLYGGDPVKWRAFANSLRLRIANRVNGVVAGAQAHVDGAIAAGVMTSNDDNAGLMYEASALNGAPMYRAFYVDMRTDFAPSMQFVQLLQGQQTGTYAGVVDPRLGIYVAPNGNGDYVGIPLCNDNGTVGLFKDESLPGDYILSPDYTEMYMEYAEVCFLLSEVNGWDQAWYEAGVRASMERWGVAAADIDAYVAGMPAANEETVLMQKYIALYMQPMEAWSEYRRTGYPNTLVAPGTTYDYTWPIASGDTTASFTFEAIGGLTDVPSRNMYLLNEASVNGASLDAASASIGGDAQDTKLIWQP